MQSLLYNYMYIISIFVIYFNDEYPHVDECLVEEYNIALPSH